jgi:branched-chain amino acid transport system ATP-binding protein
VRYGAVTALRDVRLSVTAGECVGVVGPNGAGKSSLLLALMGVVPVAEGYVEVDGVVWHRVPTARRVQSGLSLVPEGRRIFGALTVEQNLRLGMAALSSTRRRVDEARLLERAYDLFPVLQSLRSRPAGVLSGGEAQMLAIGRALMADPQLLLLDEPTLGLAPGVVEALTGQLRSLKRGGLTMLIIEQRLDVIRQLADRIIVLRNGSVWRELTPTALREVDPRALYFPEHAG